jgi:hypothetical protein
MVESCFPKNRLRCFLSVLVVISPCHLWLTPLVVTLTGSGKRRKILSGRHCPGPFEPDSKGPRQCSLTTESQWPHPTAALLRCRDQPLRGVTDCTGAPCPYHPHPAPLPSGKRERERPSTSRSSSAGAYNGRGYKRHGSRVVTQFEKDISTGGKVDYKKTLDNNYCL